MQFVQLLLIEGLFLPLVGFIILLATSNTIGRKLAGIIACGTIFLSFISFCTLLFSYTYYGMEPQSFSLFRWIPIAGINADFLLRLDSLSLLMGMIISGVSFLIHVYSMGYMEHEEDYARYFACLNFFVFAMLLLVLAGHLLLLFVGWEGVGLASYLLIGFFYHRPSAAAAATKAFVVNRVGDCGFLIGLLLTFKIFGTGNIVEISQKVGSEFTTGAPILLLLTLLYFWGATAKSAQIPLHVWLPDAMEGPTPVSALIHAATMVTAGVYLVVRMHDVFDLASLSLYVIGIVGTATALFAAICAVGQTDLKKVLAYSTISQLGFMFIACGAGAYYAAMFHLTTHAFMKALLFLAAGNVIHMMQGTTDMDKMGGLSKKFPLTHWFFGIGVLAMAGIPLLAGFFSKDLILEQEHASDFIILFTLGSIAAVLTAFYLTRAYMLTFTGSSRLEPKILKSVKDAPKIMIVPVGILSCLAIFGGFLGYSFNGKSMLQRFLEPIGVRLAVDEPFSLVSPITLFSVLGSILGIAVATILYTRYSNHLGKPFKILRKAFYIDNLYDWVFVRPLNAIAHLVVTVTEPKLFDGSVKAATYGTKRTAMALQHMQSGQIRSYVAWMGMGIMFLIVYLVW